MQITCWLKFYFESAVLIIWGNSTCRTQKSFLLWLVCFIKSKLSLLFTGGVPIAKIQGDTNSRYENFRYENFKYEYWKIEFECFPTVYGMPMMINTWVSYIVGKLLSPSFQWTCILWETRGTRTCIHVHVMGASVYNKLANKGKVPQILDQ